MSLTTNWNKETKTLSIVIDGTSKLDLNLEQAKSLKCDMRFLELEEKVKENKPEVKYDEDHFYLFFVAQRKCLSLPDEIRNDKDYEEVGWENYDYIQVGILRKRFDKMNEKDKKWIQWNGTSGHAHLDYFDDLIDDFNKNREIKVPSASYFLLYSHENSMLDRYSTKITHASHQDSD